MMRTDDFDFDLPADRIAQTPVRPRDAARLLHVGRELADRGVREAQIAALAGWCTSNEFDAKEKAALALGEAVTQGRVNDEVYQEALRHFDHHDYVELAVTASFYAMVARVLDAMGVQLEPDFREYSPKL
jgi:alkylhydroperoxidase family enzyme